MNGIVNGNGFIGEWVEGDVILVVDGVKSKVWGVMLKWKGEEDYGKYLYSVKNMWLIVVKLVEDIG